MRMMFSALFLLLCLTTARPAAAQDEGRDFKTANNRMMADMSMQPTGDADRDFVMMMIPHHQGAIDMAKVELQYGHDPQLRKLAAGIIRAQEKEIAQMKAWQAGHATRTTK